MRVVCLSDTHALHQQVEVPDGDLLVHAGDLTRMGDLADVRAFDRWLQGLPHPHKVVIAGNHDFCFEREPGPARASLESCTYLQDAAVTAGGLTVYGSPWQPWFFDWAFNLERGEPLRQKWDLIPADCDILVTHGPPLGHGDRTAGGDLAGCEELLAAIQRVQPALHVFGHIHEGYGETWEGPTRCVNASTCTLGYAPENRPIVVDL
jgi:predicted phosphohydrolase